MQIVNEEAEDLKSDDRKTRSGLSKAQFTDIFMTLVKTAAESFKDKWNKHNPDDLVDFRFVMSKGKVPNHTQIKAQASLAFEIKRKDVWQVSSRTIKNFATERLLRDMETEYTFQLWSDMFSEITQIGFISVINYLANKDSGDKTEDDQRPVISGDSSEVEDYQG